MRATRVAIGAGILMIVIGMAGVAAGPATIAALAQGTPPGGASGMGMMGGMGGMGMMGGPFTASARPVSMARAMEVLRQWPVAHHLDDLVLDEVEAYTVNYYGQFKERSTGRAAAQVLVDRYTGAATPEMGPNMMWNTKYGQAMMQEMMGGMMGMMGGGMGSSGMMGTPAPQTGTTAPASQLAIDQARRAADQFLSGYLPGAAVGDGDAFYGYYHFDVMRGGRQVGMLSVNATTGQVWYHTWHGEFLQKQEVHQ